MTTSTWNLDTAALQIVGPAGDKRTGETVALSGDGSVPAVGENGNVRMFLRDPVDGTWSSYGSPIVIVNISNPPLVSVALSHDGTVLVIGEPEYASGVHANEGRVRIFNFISGDWALYGTTNNTITGSYSGATGFKVGNSVAISGDGSVVAVGAPGFFVYPGGGRTCGNVQVYRFDSGGWVPHGTHTDFNLTSNSGFLTGTIENGYFGFSVALSGNGSVLAVGEPGYSYQGLVKGRVQVFGLYNGTWSLVGSQIADLFEGVVAGSRTGNYVALSSGGNVVAFGEPVQDDMPRVRVRIYDAGSRAWTAHGTDPNPLFVGANAYPTPDITRPMGSVSLSGDGTTLAIGEPGFNTGSDLSYKVGRVQVFRYSGSEWVLHGVDQATTFVGGIALGSQFGSSVSLLYDGNAIATGEPGFNNSGTTVPLGQAYVFRIGTSAAEPPIVEPPPVVEPPPPTVVADPELELQIQLLRTTLRNNRTAAIVAIIALVVVFLAIYYFRFSSCVGN